MTAPLTIQPNSPEWFALRKRAITDLYWFADIVLGYGQLVPMTPHTHYAMCRFAEHRTGIPALDEAHYRMVSVPRGVGKTTLITRARSIQLALANPDIAILIANERQENANAFLAEIKSHFEGNDFLRALFPERMPGDFLRDWSAERALLPRGQARVEPTFMTIGVGGTITGMHPDVIICDDVISREAMENARAGSWQIMERTNRWINQLRPLLNLNYPAYEIFVVGTRWWQGDSYEHIERSFGYGETEQKFLLKTRLADGSTQTLPAFRRGDLAIFRRAIIEDGVCIFPEKYSLDDLAKIRVADELLYAANFMNNPTDQLIATFKANWLRYFSYDTPRQVHFVDRDGKDRYVLTDDLDCVLSVDPAFAEGEGRSRAALVLTGSTDDGHRLLLVADAKKGGAEALTQDIVALCTTWKPRKLLIERAGQQAAFILYVRQALEKARLFTPIVEVTPGGRKKDVRIMTLEPYFQRGIIYVQREQHDFLNEYTGFPRTEFKDLLDALSYQPPEWRNPTNAGLDGSPLAEQRVRAERERLYQKMGTRPTPAKRELKDIRFREDGSKRW